MMANTNKSRIIIGILLGLQILSIQINWATDNCGNPERISDKYSSDLPRSSIAYMWDSDGIGICNYTSDQENPKFCPDGIGGTIVTWTDLRTDTGDIYAQRISKQGASYFTPNGTEICTYTDAQYSPEICSDGSNGAFIAWNDGRNGDDDIYIQLLTNFGEKAFDIDGIGICNETGNQRAVKICSDGSNGAILSWIDRRTGTYDIYAQRIDHTGNTLWDNNGTVVCNAVGTQGSIQMISDGEGGVIIAWEDWRGPGVSDIYAQKINSSGFSQWDDNGSLICNAEDLQKQPQICSDGNGGAIIAWYDERNPISVEDIYVQRIDINGTILWDLNGTVVCNENEFQGYTSIISDGDGGAIITWRDFRSIIDYDIFAQKVNSAGETQWTSNGTAVCAIDGDQFDPEICTDGNGGAILVWKDDRNSNFDIYCQKITSLGIPYWSANGIAITTSLGIQENYQIISDNFGGATFIWEDGHGVDQDIYALRIKENPLVTINSPTSNALFSSTSPTFNVEYISQDLDDMWYTVNGGTVNPVTANDTISQSIWDGLGNGSVTIQFYADDSENLQGFAEVIVHRDIEAPVLTILDPENNQEFLESIPSFSITVEDSNLDQIWYTLNDGPPIAVINLTQSISEEAWNSLDPGNIEIRFYANDTLGNVRSVDRIVVKSVTSPWERIEFWGVGLLALALVVTVMIAARNQVKLKKVIKENKKLIESYELKREIKLFVSYAHKDSDLFQIPKIEKTLEEFPKITNIFYSEKDSNVNWVDYMETYLRKADGVLLFCTKKSIKSKHVKTEYEAAVALEKEIIPIFIDLDDVPVIFRAKVGSPFIKNKFEVSVDGIYGLIKKRFGEEISK